MAVVVAYAIAFPFFLFHGHRQPATSSQVRANGDSRPMAMRMGEPGGQRRNSMLGRLSRETLPLDAGPFVELFTRIAEKHRRRQDDILRGKVPLKRAIIGRCSRSQACAGHGDRVYGMLTLYLSAILTDRAFFLDYTRPKPMQDYVEPRKFEWRIGAIQNDELRRNVTACAASESHFYRECSLRPVFIPESRCQDLLNLVHSDLDFIVSTGNMRTECIQKLLMKHGLVPPIGKNGFQDTDADMRFWAANVSHVMLNWLFRFKPDITSLGSQVLTPSSRSDPVSPECLVCIHVRSGVGLGEDPRHTNWRDFASCAEKVHGSLLKAKRCPTNPTWLVVGDTTWAGKAIKERITMKPKPSVLTTNMLGAPTHVNQNNDATHDSIAHVYVDWYLLSQCEYIVASLSTFGATAALIGGPRVMRYDMEVGGRSGGCVRHSISDWQRDANA